MNKVIVTILTLVSLLMMLGPLSWGSSSQLRRNLVVWLALTPGFILLLEGGVKWLSHQKANQDVREIKIGKGIGSYPGEQEWQREMERGMTFVFRGIVLGTTAGIALVLGLGTNVILLIAIGFMLFATSLALVLWGLRFVAKLERSMEESFRSKAQKGS